MSKSFLTIAVLTSLLVACNSSQENKPEPAPAPEAAPETPVTIIYEGKLDKTLWGDTNVPIKITIDKAAGTFTEVVDYDNTKSHEGQKVVDINDVGTFKLVKDAKWGEMYVLEGKLTGTTNYQIVGNKIKEIGAPEGYSAMELEMK